MNNDYTTTLNYLGTDINTTWQSPSKRSYIVSSDNRAFKVHPYDVAWFLTRMVRGNPLFSIVEITPVQQPVTVEIAEELPFKVIEDAPQIEVVEAAEIQEEPTEKKRTRKSKAAEIQDTVTE